MKCPACDAENSFRWTPPVYQCRECLQEITRELHEELLSQDYDRWLASPPEEQTIDTPFQK